MLHAIACELLGGFEVCNTITWPSTSNRAPLVAGGQVSSFAASTAYPGHHIKQKTLQLQNLVKIVPVSYS